MKGKGTVTLFRLVRKRRNIWLTKGELHLTGSGLRGEGMTDAHEGDCPSGQGVWPHRRVLPVQDDLWDVLHGVQQVVVPPLIPVDGHRAVLVHAARQNHGHSMCHTPSAPVCPLDGMKAGAVATKETEGARVP